ncbi:nucleotidyltransferase family protein [Peptococcaceae bacterium 1198_IL3148]
MIDALVLAGSPNDGRLKSCSTAEYEALIPIGNKAMVEYVVSALIKSRNINRIVIVGPKELASVFSGLPIKIVESQGKMMDNLYSGLTNLSDSERTLVVTADIPLVTAKILDDFLSLCGDKKSDLYYPVVPKATVSEKFPSVTRTYVKLKDGVFTGGNVFLVNPSVVPKCLEKGQQFVDLRKSPVKLCKMLGLGFLIKFLSRRLSLKEVERKASLLFGIKGQAVICHHPEVGLDIDKPSDLTMAVESLGANVNVN